MIEVSYLHLLVFGVLCLVIGVIMGVGIKRRTRTPS